jgi:hypothetical protein
VRTLAAAGAAGIVTVAAAVATAWSLQAFGARSVWFAFLMIWIPVSWAATVGHLLGLRLPRRLTAIRDVERDGRLYELLGVRVAKRLLRRGPLAVFAPALRLPAMATPDTIARLEDRMREAETVHGPLLVVSLAVVVIEAARGWWDAAGWTLLFDVLINAYPTMLQRYNRAFLLRHFGEFDSTRPSART